MIKDFQKLVSHLIHHVLDLKSLLELQGIAGRSFLITGSNIDEFKFYSICVKWRWTKYTKFEI